MVEGQAPEECLAEHDGNQYCSNCMTKVFCNLAGVDSPPTEDLKCLAGQVSKLIYSPSLSMT